jgi:hypothetical protein
MIKLVLFTLAFTILVTVAAVGYGLHKAGVTKDLEAQSSQVVSEWASSASTTVAPAQEKFNKDMDALIGYSHKAADAVTPSDATKEKVAKTVKEWTAF